MPKIIFPLTMDNLTPRPLGDCVERRRKAHFDFLIAAYRFFRASDGKQHKTRTVEISPASPEQSTSAESTPSARVSSLTATGKRNCRALAMRARARFHCEFQKLRRIGVADVTTPGFHCRPDRRNSGMGRSQRPKIILCT